MNSQFIQKNKLPEFLANYHSEDIRIEKKQNGEETYVFDPYNHVNVELTETDVRKILSSYGINTPINNFQLYRRAFIHQSYTKHPEMENKENNVEIAKKPEGCLPISTKSNERLEFVGDGVLECITKYYLYRRFPNEDEGFMTEKKIALVKNESIGKIAHEMGLQKWFVLSKTAEQKELRTNFKKLGCLFEAFIGAMFLDYNKIVVEDKDGWFSNLFVCGPGFQMVQIFVEAVFEKHVDFDHLIRNDDNYKKYLQMILQKEFKVTPHYLEINEHSGGDGYNMGVYLCMGQHIHEAVQSGTAPLLIKNYSSFNEIHQYMLEHSKIFLFLGEGKHKMKKKAEQMACEDAIHVLKNFLQ
jgi:dsRNA-specific ribonuclease